MELRERILQTALELFFQKGIKAVSMDDVATRLAVSKKTIYKCFTNKDELVFEAMKPYIKSLEQSCFTSIENSENAMEGLFRMVEMVKEIMRQVHPSIFFDLQKYHPSAWNLWVEHRNSFFLAQVKENIQRGIEEKLFRKDIDVEIMSRLRLAETELAFNSDFYPATQFDLQKVQLTLLEHYMLGLSTLKGHQLINQYKQITEEE
ncbi:MULTISPECIES: TetR/AcrR family transcriptional regulator [Rufibacter]|uniref:AcrR family transcriptional regulator n=1 Tax=Rufibacter quisquiliarum TaxID=1549639 RepID=A0A839GJ45_9BACT|nr:MULTISPECIES: TetR/AcrR family transcriptional regulator [Rufibacter]MBA9079644.1 AcrR family transcriptional regulator [Rufibacter quisquiliarum]